MPKCLLECLKEAKANSKSDYVVANSDGGPLSYTQFKRVWQYIVTRSNKERTYIRYINGQKIKGSSRKVRERNRKKPDKSEEEAIIPIPISETFGDFNLVVKALKLSG